MFAYFSSFFIQVVFFAEFAVTIPEILAIGAAMSVVHVAFASIPIDFAISIVSASGTALPIYFQKISALDFFNDESHRHQVFLNLCLFHQFIEFINFFVSSIKVDDENFFCKYW